MASFYLGHRGVDGVDSTCLRLVDRIFLRGDRDEDQPVAVVDREYGEDRVSGRRACGVLPRHSNRPFLEPTVENVAGVQQAIAAAVVHRSKRSPILRYHHPHPKYHQYSL